MAHIIDRFIIHFFASAGVVLMALFTLRYASRKLKTKLLPVHLETQIIVAALAVFADATLREAWDVHSGQALVKAITDYISWLLGCGCTAWGLYRLIKEVRP